MFMNCLLFLRVYALLRYKLNCFFFSIFQVNHFPTMDQSTEKLLKTSSDSPLEGISNDIDSGPSSLNFDNPYSLDAIYQYPATHYKPPTITQPSPGAPTNNAVPTFAIGSATSGSTLQLPPYRTRHLSCIIENWSESESYNSLPPEVTSSKKNDDLFSQIGKPKTVPWEAEDLAEYITTLDESCILDIESIEEISNIDGNDKAPNWKSMIYGPKYKSFDDINKMNGTTAKSGGPVEKYPKIMTTSCYGTLNNPFIDNEDSPAAIAAAEKESYLNGSSENLLNDNSGTDHYIVQQLISNEAKCRSPISTSMSNSLYDGSSSMNNSFYQSNAMQSSIECSGNKINSLESSMVLTQSDDGKVVGEECGSSMTDVVNSGEYNFNDFL